MPIIYKDNIYRNTREQVLQNVEDIKTLNDKVSKIDNSAITNNTNEINKIKASLRGVYDMEMKQVIIMTTDWSELNTSVNDEIFKTTAEIFVFPTSDNGENIVDNNENIGKFKVQALDVSVNGTLNFKAKTKPDKDLYFNVYIMNEINGGV